MSRKKIPEGVSTPNDFSLLLEIGEKITANYISKLFQRIVSHHNVLVKISRILYLFEKKDHDSS